MAKLCHTVVIPASCTIEARGASEINASLKSVGGKKILDLNEVSWRNY